MKIRSADFPSNYTLDWLEVSRGNQTLGNTMALQREDFFLISIF